MAQRTEKEETEFKVGPETIILCVNNCGVIGSPANNNMCQNCFNAVTTSSSSSAAAVMCQKPISISCRSPKRSSSPSETVRIPIVLGRSDGSESAVSKREVNRCSGCHRKVGLTGFRCRCGDLFCADHRYSDRHDCSYDYKTAGREAIARENPVVKAAKIVRV